eukprot:jgi/Mesvir1/8717/Mv02647-RA.1
MAYYAPPAISTCDVTLLSHTHGRLRREERGIERSELQAAVKHGRKEAANPGPLGDPRWRYTHKGVVYITDATSRHEITSWRIDGDDGGRDGDAVCQLVRVGDSEYTSHTVLIVDASGSMRKADVPGYTCRTDAVYDCLAREFVEPQLAMSGGVHNGGIIGDMGGRGATQGNGGSNVNGSGNGNGNSGVYNFSNGGGGGSTPGGGVNNNINNVSSNSNNDYCGNTANSNAVYGRSRAINSQDKAVASLIEMSDEARVILNRVPVNEALAEALRGRRSSHARSHGNYLPALQKAIELLREDAHHNARLFVLFLSDGAPSDHNELACDHDVQVWQPDLASGRRFKGKPALMVCPTGREACRRSVLDRVRNDCLRAVTTLGDLFGRDRTYLGTVAFGPPGDDYAVLQEMAKQLPRSSFQKLGLQVGGLRTALSSLTSELTMLRTEAGGVEGRGLRGGLGGGVLGGMGGGIGGGGEFGPSKGTLRDKVVHKEESGGSILSSFLGAVAVTEWDGWSLYDGADVRKYRYDVNDRDLVEVGFDEGASGMAFYKDPFAQGVERYVYRCMEISAPRFLVGRAFATQVGKKLVAKEAKVNEHLGLKFQKDFCRTQSEAAALARLFNDRVRATDPSWHLDFLQCHIYQCEDARYPDGVAWVLAEPELEGRFYKWNNNGGGVSGRAYPPTPGRGGAHSGTQSVYSGGGNAYANAGTGAVANLVSGLGALTLGAIVEDDEDSFPQGHPPGYRVQGSVNQLSLNSSHREDGGGADDGSSGVELHEIPQCFSHFTYVVTGRKKLVCDLQGVWNATDGFVLTDPVIHYVSNSGRRGINGLTDKGQEGVDRFFQTHRCGALCRRLGLQGAT